MSHRRSVDVLGNVTGTSEVAPSSVSASRSRMRSVLSGAASAVGRGVMNNKLLIAGAIAAASAAGYAYETNMSFTGPSHRSALSRANEVSPENKWNHGITLMQLGDRAHEGRRQISRATQMHEDLSAAEIANINDILKSSLIPAEDARLIEGIFPGRTLTAEHAADPLMLSKADQALVTASAAFSNLALDDFAHATREPSSANSNWAEYMRNHLANNFMAEPMHMNNIILALWRANRIEDANKLAELMFSLPSWQAYQRDFPDDAASVVRNCSRSGFHVSNLPSSNPVVATDAGTAPTPSAANQADTSLGL